jgi:hypothetical protein
VVFYVLPIAAKTIDLKPPGLPQLEKVNENNRRKKFTERMYRGKRKKGVG